MKTRNLLVLFVFCILCFLPSLTFANMLISGVIDGPLSGGTPKAVEFFVLEDIADLSEYGFGSANNGGGSDGQEFTFASKSASKGQFIYVSYDSAGFAQFFGFDPDTTSGAAQINGDDAIELFHNGAVIDVFGDINVDGTGEPWEYMDGWAYRKNGTGPDGSTFVLDNWLFSGPNALDGETSNATAATPFPIGTYEPNVAVWLTSFGATLTGNHCLVFWTTALEVSCAGFNVLRADDEDGPYERRNDFLIPAQGAVGASRYEFVDEEVRKAVYFYKLEEIDVSGVSTFYGPVKAAVNNAVSKTSAAPSPALLGNYPNPFNPDTRITWQLPAPQRVRLIIMNAAGRIVRTLVDAQESAGVHAATWDGLDDVGRRVASGVYFYRLQAGDFCEMKKMTLLR